MSCEQLVQVSWTIILLIYPTEIALLDFQIINQDTSSADVLIKNRLSWICHHIALLFCSNNRGRYSNALSLSIKFLEKLKQYFHGKGHPVHADFSKHVIILEQREEGEENVLWAIKQLRCLLLATESDLLGDDLPAFCKCKSFKYSMPRHYWKWVALCRYISFATSTWVRGNNTRLEIFVCIYTLIFQCLICLL